MRTSRVTLVGAAILALLIGPTGAVSAMMNEEEIPAAFVTGTVIESSELEDKGRAAYEQTVDWSDPRLPPTLRIEGAWYLYGDLTAAWEHIEAGESEDEALASRVVIVVEMNVLLDGADGSWQGTGRYIRSGDDRYSYYVLSGDGPYDGFHALLRGAPDHDTDGPWDEEYECWIIESPLPPAPEAPPTE